MFFVLYADVRSRSRVPMEDIDRVNNTGSLEHSECSILILVERKERDSKRQDSRFHHICPLQEL